MSAKHIGRAFPCQNIIKPSRGVCCASDHRYIICRHSSDLIIIQDVKAVFDGQNKYYIFCIGFARCNVITTVSCQHLKAQCDARYTFDEPNTV